MRISIVGITWYKREDYEKLKSLFVDGRILPESYDDWLQSAEEVVNGFRAQGQAFKKVYIDPNTFPVWCASKGLEINANARSRFSAEQAYKGREI